MNKNQAKKLFAFVMFLTNLQMADWAHAAPPVLNATASALSGVAPMGVFFDATNTTSNVASEPFTEIEYEWNFGDPGSGTWQITGQTKNKALGALAAHVFDSPGSYLVQLTARDAQGGVATQNFTITVTDPDVVFSGNNTICFSPTDFVGCPTGAQQVSTNQWGSLQPYIASGKRLLLRRGATFVGAAGLYMSSDGPGDISTFGSGARPIIQAQGSVIPITQPWQDASVDWRVRGLDFRGSYPGNPTPGNGIEFGNRWLVQNNIITSFQYGAIAAGFTRNDIYLVENDIVDNKHLGTYISGISPGIAIFGNRFRCPTTSASTSLLRTYVKKVIMSHNQFDEIGGAGSHQIKFCGGSVSDPSRYSIVSSNIFNDPAIPNTWMVSVGPENNDPTSLQPVEDFIFERNIVRAPVTNSLGFQSRGASKVTIRNNIFYNTTGINMSVPVPGFSAWDRWHILNNVFYNSFTGAYVLNTDQPLTNLRVQNNIVSFPNVTSAANASLITLSATPRSQITDTHNTWYIPQVPMSGNVFRSLEGSYSRQNWASQTCANGAPCGQSMLTSDPQFQNTSNADFHIQSGSPSLDSGVSLSAVLSDFSGDARNGAYDRGIFNGGTGTGGGGGGSSGPQCNDGIDNDGDGLIDWQYDLGCNNQTDTTEGGISAALDNGWTVFEKSADTRIVYVSQSQGNDSYTGLCPDAPASGNCGPKQTVSSGYSEIRNGYPDWLLFRRGDTWTGQGFTPWMKSGRSATERIVIGSYGNSNVRPKLVTDSGFYTIHTIPVNFIALMDLNFVRMTVTGTGSSGVFILGDGRDFLMENLKVEQFSGNLGMQANAVGTLLNFAIRRCIVVDAYTVSTDHAEGSYFDGVDGLLLEESLWDHNGWSETIPQATPPTMFRRNIYSQHSIRNLQVKSIISARSGSEGIQMRSGGTLDNSLFLKNSGNSFGCGMSGYPGNCSQSNPPRSGYVRRNVFLDSRDIVPVAEPRGGGMEFDVAQAVVSENIFAHGTDPATYNVMAINIGQVDNSFTLENNVVYNWYRPGDPGLALNIGKDQSIVVRNNSLQMTNTGGLINLGFTGAPSALSLTGNHYYSQNPAPFNWGNTYSQWIAYSGETNSSFGPSGFPEPTRSIETYMQSLGQAPTLDAFLSQARLQSKWNWRPEYTAAVVNDYIRAGFGIGPYVPVNYAPAVNAGPNQTITAPADSVTLAGIVTDDGLPNPPAATTVSWSRLSGPGVVTFGNTSSLSTTATFSQPGIYVLRLTANDSALSGTDDVQITVNSESGSGNQSGGPAVTETRLKPCSNPKNPEERSRIPVCFDVKESGNVSVVIYSRQGKRVRELINGHRDVGEHQIFWDLTDDSGNGVSSGAYTVLFESAGVKQKIKAAVVR